MKRLVAIVCIYLISEVKTEFDEKVSYNGSQLWKISIKNKATLDVLNSLENKKLLSLWSANSINYDVMVKDTNIKEVQSELKGRNINHDIVIEDLQQVINNENIKIAPEIEERRGYRLTWNYYYNLDDIYDFLHYVELSFPKLCSVHTIGYSFEGRPIKLLKLSNGNPENRAIFIEGGMHAREWISPAAVTYAIQKFISNHQNEPLYTRIKNLDWYFVPVLNPDGYVYSYTYDRLWRKNRSRSGSSKCVGVDLNRNFGYDWAKNGSSKDPCSDSYRGRKPFSEPETVAVANFFINNYVVNWVAYVAVHSYGQHIVYPWGASNATLDSVEIMKKIGADAAKNILESGGKNYTVGPARTTIYKASGIAMDWAKGSLDIKYAFTLELRDQGEFGYILPSKYIKPTSEETLIAMRTIASNIKN